MKKLTQENINLPLRSRAGALLFAIFFGPIGLLYASSAGGIIMIIFSFIAISSKLWIAAAIGWVVSTIWAIFATNRYNIKILRVRAQTMPMVEVKSQSPLS